MLFLDGVFVGNTFKESYAPSTESIDKLTEKSGQSKLFLLTGRPIFSRLTRSLERDSIS